MKRSLVIILSIILMISAFGCVKNKPSDNFEDDEDVFIKPDSAISRDGKYVDYINAVGFATGKNAKAKSTVEYGVYGTDIGIPFYSEQQQTMYFCFGDTYANNNFGYPWNSNAILYTNDLKFDNGINYSGAINGIATKHNYGTKNKMRQITPDAYLESNYPNNVTEAYHPNTELNVDGCVLKTHTCIPTGAIELNGNFYMFYMEVTSLGFGATGQWTIHSNRVMKSTDLGKTWSQFPPLKWDYSFAPNFGQIFPIIVDDYVYIYGLAGGRQSSAKLARVKVDKFENMDEYEYYVETKNDVAKFIKGSDGLAVIKNDKLDKSSVIYGPCGEMSVMYNEYLNKFVATYQMGSSIIMRVADNPYGPFSKAETVYNNGEFGLNDCYGAFTNSKMVMGKGKKMYFLMSLWFPVYNVQLMELVLK